MAPSRASSQRSTPWTAPLDRTIAFVGGWQVGRAGCPAKEQRCAPSTVVSRVCQRLEALGGTIRISTVFKKLLSLQGAWVRKIAFTSKAAVVTVSKKNRRHRCPRCVFSTRAGYDHHTGSWRLLALGKWQVVLRSEVYRLVCPIHGVITETVPWAVPGSRFTRDFEDLAWLAREMNFSAVAKLIHVTWRTVGRIIRRVVGRKLNAKRLDELFVIGVDEASYRKGHKYLTVVADHGSGDPAWITEGRSQKSLGKLFGLSCPSNG